MCAEQKDWRRASVGCDKYAKVGKPNSRSDALRAQAEKSQISLSKLTCASILARHFEFSCLSRHQSRLSKTFQFSVESGPVGLPRELVAANSGETFVALDPIDPFTKPAFKSTSSTPTGTCLSPPFSPIGRNRVSTARWQLLLHFRDAREAFPCPRSRCRPRG